MKCGRKGDRVPNHTVSVALHRKKIKKYREKIVNWKPMNWSMDRESRQTQSGPQYTSQYTVYLLAYWYIYWYLGVPTVSLMLVFHSHHCSLSGVLYLWSQPWAASFLILHCHSSPAGLPGLSNHYVCLYSSHPPIHTHSCLGLGCFCQFTWKSSYRRHFGPQSTGYFV